MSASAIPLSRLATSRRWQTNFLAVLTTVETHAKISFRRLRPEARAEAVAETVARAFCDYGHLARQRRLSCAYPGSLATFAVRAVRGHRKVGCRQNAKDALSPIAQKKHAFTASTLTPWKSAEGTWREVVVESKRFSPADRAVFTLDFAEWLRQWPPRHREIINALAAGERTNAVAQRFGVTEGRVSQFRKRYQESWDQFQGAEWE
jgi:hypothetical protein